MNVKKTKEQGVQSYDVLKKYKEGIVKFEKVR
jgi:hypothetical protein